MTLELPAATHHTPKEASGSSSRTAKTGGHTSGGREPADAAGFLALLMELDLAPEAEAPVEQIEVLDATGQFPLIPDAAINVVDADKMVTPMPIPSDTSAGGNDRRGGNVSLSNAREPRIRESVSPLESFPLKNMSPTAMAAPFAKAALPSETFGTLDTRQLQLEPHKVLAEVNLKHELARPAQDVQVTSPATAAVSTPLEDNRKVLQVIHAKIDTVDGGAVLSGLTGTIAGVPELLPAEKQSQLQSAVAQEVSYFISKDIQSAEMKLEGLGGAAVEVSINMQGKEAQVVFRSDEVQTRELLEISSGHLKDMLQQEGVVLTGVQVGTSGAGDSGQQDRKPRTGARSETMVIVQPTISSAAPSLSGVGRTLDLYA